MMEKKDFSAAAIYFDRLLATDPTNREKALLLSRALGLSAQYDRSAGIMDSLNKLYPGNKDMLVSRAELWLWQKNGKEAIKLLEPLYTRFPDDNAVLFNYCNALILDKHFTDALPVLEAVRRRTDGKSPWPDMLKNLRINYALQLRTAENYEAAVVQLDSILLYLPKDPGTLLLKGDLMLQRNLYKQAATTYRLLLPLHYERAITLVNLSYALFMAHKPALALQQAKLALLADTAAKLPVVNYFNALLWNLKTRQAGRFLNSNRSRLNTSDILILQARLETTSGRFLQGLRFYDSVVHAYPNKYYVQEYAEVLVGKKEISLAETTMAGAQDKYSASEWKLWQQKLDNAKRANVTFEASWFSDIGKNVRWSESVVWNDREGKRFRWYSKLGQTQVLQTTTKEKTLTNFGIAGINERFNRIWSGQTELDILQVIPNTGSGSTVLTGRQLIQYQPTDHFMFGLQYNSELLNFTSTLLQKAISSHNVGYLTNWMLAPKTGIYSQGAVGFLTDHNQLNRIFVSLYQLLRTEPTIKIGINVSALHYADSSIKYYFAPNRYLTAECFAEYTSALQAISRLYYSAQAGLGLQQIERGNPTTALRFQVEGGYRWNRIEAGIKYLKSNIAGANGAGYKFNWVTMRFVYRW